MHQRIFAALFISFFSTFLIAMEDDPEELDPIEKGEEGLTIGQAIALLEQAKDQPITLKECALPTAGTMTVGIILDVLGGVGVRTCPDWDVIEAAKVLCGFSGAGLALGGICTIAAFGMPFGIYYYNNYIVEPRNQTKTELSTELAVLNLNLQLKGNDLIKFLALIKDKEVILEEVNRLCNREQGEELKPTLEIRTE